MGLSSISKPKRSLGQNFFINANLGKNITEKVTEDNPKKVVEIGPGRGFFTKLFVEKGLNVLAIEKDNILAENLKFILPSVEVCNEDVFSVELTQNPHDTVCFGSLPYNISKRIIAHFAENTDFKNLYFIIQKEVAEKYVAKRKDSLLSITTKTFFDSKIIYNISPENFKPRPNVVSSFIKFVRNSNVDNVEDITEFFKYLHRAFKQPRKTLKNNLQKYYEPGKVNADLLKNRAEDLDFNNHLELWKNLMKKAL